MRARVKVQGRTQVSEARTSGQALRFYTVEGLSLLSPSRFPPFFVGELRSTCKMQWRSKMTRDVSGRHKRKGRDQN